MQKELEPVARSLPKPPHDRSRFTQKSNHKFAPSPGHFYPNPYVRENGSSASLNLRQELWDNLKEYIESSLDPSSGNNNSTADSFSDKMATSSSSGTKQTASANGYQMPLASAPALPSKSAGFSITPSGHFNNQIVDSSGQPTVRSSHAHVSPNPASMKFLAANQLSQGSVLPQQSQYNQYDTPQEMLLRGYSGPTEDIPGAPRALQYGSQQRWNESTGLNRHTASPFSQPFYAQDSHNSLTGSRSTNSQQEERNMITKQHYHWPQQSHSQAGFGQAGISSNAIPNASVSRTQNEVSTKKLPLVWPRFLFLFLRVPLPLSRGVTRRANVLQDSGHECKIFVTEEYSQWRICNTDRISTLQFFQAPFWRVRSMYVFWGRSSCGWFDVHHFVYFKLGVPPVKAIVLFIWLARPVSVYK